VGLDRQRADAAGQQVMPVPGLACTTAAALARRVIPAQWEQVGTGLAVVTGWMLSLLPPQRAAALAGGLGHHRPGHHGRGGLRPQEARGVAYNHQGQRVGRPHVATWAETETVLAADLGSGTHDPHLLGGADPPLATARAS
jgi:hypothetical protein